MHEDLQILEASGPELGPWLDPLGDLRIRVFREFPYLYEGTLEYEREYLRTYLEAPDSRVVLVVSPKAGVVGATTCVPLAREEPEFKEPFLRAGWNLSEICYFGESLLLPELRGRGLGKEFFARRESHADRLGLPVRAFCAVDRPPDHPLRPPDYRPLDGFWESRGFVKRPELRARFEWKEIGEDAPSPKTLTFWVKKRIPG